MARRLRATIAGSAVVCALGVLPALAQDAAEEPVAPETEAPEPDEPPPLAEVLAATARDQSRLRALRERAAPAAEIDSIREQLQADAIDLAAQIKEAEAQIDGALSFEQLLDLEKRWSREEQKMEASRDRLTARAAELQAGIEEADEVGQLWTAAMEQAVQLRAPEAVGRQIKTVLDSVDETRVALRARWGAVLDQEIQLGHRLERLASLVERAGVAQDSVRSSLLASGTQPLWTALRGARSVDRVPHAMRHAREELEGYLVDSRRALVQHGVIIALVLLLVFAVRRRVPAPSDADSRVATTLRLLERPFASGLLMAWLPAPALYANAPQPFFAIAGLVPAIAFLRLVPTLMAPRGRGPVYVLLSFFAVDRLRDLLVAAPLLARVTYELELIAAAVVALWATAPDRLTAIGVGGRFMTSARVLLRAAMVALASAAVASVLGFERLALAIGEGTLRSGYSAVILFAIYRLVSGVAVASLRIPALERLNAVRRHRSLLESRLVSGAALGLGLGWVVLALGYLGVRDTLSAAAASVLGATAQVGELDLGLGDLIALGVGATLAIYVSRLVRFVLEEDVVSRLPLPRGVPHAISVTAGYVVLILGFVIALAAAGIDVSRFGLLAGAFGVGIGFGLQNVVNNFVSGLILIFERPVQVGDTIEVGALLGQVKRIGIRSSTVRTLQGAEVIVPNGALISDQVVNWTLSDRQRRIDVPIGVKYGTDPEQVLELLLGVARDEPRLLETPEPSALFIGHGDSSLDFELRAWTALFEDWMQIRSSVTVAVNRALSEAEIEIPFPQRDLHVRSVDPSVAQPKA